MQAQWFKISKLSWINTAHWLLSTYYSIIDMLVWTISVLLKLNHLTILTEYRHQPHNMTPVYILSICTIQLAPNIQYSCGISLNRYIYLSWSHLNRDHNYISRQHICSISWVYAIYIHLTDIRQCWMRV